MARAAARARERRLARIRKVDTRLQGSAHGVGAMLFGAPFLAIGGYFALAGFGAIPMPPGANAPGWVIGLVGLAFAGAGVVVSGMGLRGALRRARLRLRARDRDEEPWWGDYPWNPRGMRDRPWARASAAGSAFVFLLVFLAPFNWWAFLSGGGDWLLYGIVGLFDLVALVAGAVLVHRLLAAARFGTSQLAFRRFPFFPGERLEAALSPNRFESQQVTLRFVEERYVTTGSGKDRSTRHESRELWRETRELSAPGADELPIAFDLPDDPERITELTANPSVRYYELVVEVDRPGVDFRTTFPLPVYERPFGYRAPDRPALAALRPGGAGRLAVLVLIAGLVLGGAGYALVQSQALRWAHVRLALETVPELSPAGMQVVLDDGGAVWLLTKYDLLRVAGDDPTDVQRLVGPGGPVRAPASFATVHPQGPGRAWIGGWHGELWHLADGELAVVAGREGPLRGRVFAIVRHRGAIYVGADRLFRTSGLETPAPVDGLPAGKVRALHTDGTTLYAGVGRRLWRLGPAGHWEPLWEASAAEREITVITAGAGPELLVGTRDALQAVDPATGDARRLLGGVAVEAIARDGARLWVAAWKGGIVEGDAERWRGLTVREGLPDDDATGIARDGAGGLWITLYGAGAVHAEADALRALLVPR